jgi:hypothetical protein
MEIRSGHVAQDIVAWVSAGVAPLLTITPVASAAPAGT